MGSKHEKCWMKHDIMASMNTKYGIGAYMTCPPL